MAVTEAEFEQTKARALAEREPGRVRAARYNRRRERVIVQLTTGVEVTFPVTLAEGAGRGLAGGSGRDRN